MAEIRLRDGQMSFLGGVDSGIPPTLATEAMPEGLKRNQLAWASSATVRGGGLTTRPGFKLLATDQGWDGRFQGAFLYEPPGGFPYIIMQIGGRLWRVRVDSDNSADELTLPGDPNPSEPDMAWFVQAEQFLVIQAGDFSTLPLFWDGTALRRSNGLNPESGTRELPAAGPMDYHMGRIWYAIGRSYCAGDIVNGPSGTAPYKFRDSVLKVTENPVAVGGDGFVVPEQSGNIRALKHSANLDNTLGQSQLFVFTRSAVYATNIPVLRSEWTNANEVVQRVAQLRYGTYNDRCVVPVNGDLFYQSPDGIRSLFVAVRHFQQWGNVPISRNVNRAVFFNDRALMRFASGVEFDNRLLQTALPAETPRGVAFRAILPLDFDTIASMAERMPPAWEGAWEGLRVLQLLSGDYGGLQRCFAITVSQTNDIEVWEITLSDAFDTNAWGEVRIEWAFETPAFSWNNPFELKRLDGLEIHVDRMIGDCVFEVWYRPDQDPCWSPWHYWQEQSNLQSCQYSGGSSAGPFCPDFRACLILGPPSPAYAGPPRRSRAVTVGYQFQFRIRVRGHCRIRALVARAVPIHHAPFDPLAGHVSPPNTVG